MGWILLPRQGGWCHLRCPWVAVLAFSRHSRSTRVFPQVLCHPSRPEQTRQVVKDTSNGLREPASPPVSPHRCSCISAHLMQLSPRRHHAPQSLGRSLLQTPTEQRVSPSEKKTLLRNRWNSCILSLVPHVPFCFLTSEEKWGSDPFLTWSTHIYSDPECQTERKKEFFLSLFPPFLHLFPTWTFLSSIRTVAIFFNNFRAWAPICSVILSTVTTGIG